MDAEYASFDNYCQGHIVEYICTIPPHAERAIFSQTLIIKSIDLCDLAALMITSQKCDSVWISDF